MFQDDARGEGEGLVPTVIRWDLQGEGRFLEAIRSRLAELEPGFEGRLRFAFAGSEGERCTVWISGGTGDRSIRGAGALARAVGQQLSPWAVRLEDGPAPRLQVALQQGDGQTPHLLAHLAEGLALGLAAQRGERFSFPCHSRSYEERDLTRPSGLRAGALEPLLCSTGLAGLAPAFCRAEGEAGVNGLALVALAAWQSAWGTSRLAREQQNPLAWGAGTGGATFPSAAESVVAVAHKIRRHYLEPAGRHYHGPNLLGMNVAYARDPAWRHGVAAIWRQLAERLP